MDVRNSQSIPGLGRPMLVAMIARVVVKGRRGETDRTRSARTASLNVVLNGNVEARRKLGFKIDR